MIILLILNIILQWVVIYLIVRRMARKVITFDWTTTFFGKTRYGFTVWWWTTPYHAYCIFRFAWRNPDTIPDKPYFKGAPKWALPLWKYTI